MNWKLNQADKWLVAQIATKLEERFDVSCLKAERLIRRSNVLPLLSERPDFVHHEGPEAWANIIAMQNDLQRRNQNQDVYIN